MRSPSARKRRSGASGPAPAARISRSAIPRTSCQVRLLSAMRASASAALRAGGPGFCGVAGGGQKAA